MRGIRLPEEMRHVKQILSAAEITLVSDDDFTIDNVPLLTENILSMCLKEAVTNVVRHSGATTCHISINQSLTEVEMKIKDNGIGLTKDTYRKGNGLSGMKERLEFVNGTLDIYSEAGTTLVIKVPNGVKKV